MSDEEGTVDSEVFSVENYYSLLELLDKLGKDGVAELVSKGNPQRITRGDMIYFVKSDVNRILGDNLLEDSDSIEIIVDDNVEAEIPDLASQLVFEQSLIKRRGPGEDEEIYHGRMLNLVKGEMVYGRSRGNPQDCAAFKECGIISSSHGRLYLDEEVNLLYENLGANKSKVRGWKDKNYTTVEKGQIAVLFARETLEAVAKGPQQLTASIKLGYQMKPHFIIRISVSSKKPQG